MASKRASRKAKKSAAQKPLRVLVCGGRDYHRPEHVYDTLDAIHARTPIGEIITGGATGADSLGRNWAADRTVEWTTVRADWKTHGDAAGPMRNQVMLDLPEGPPDLVVAFPGGNGTRDMVNRATLQLGAKKVFQAKPDGPLTP
jgi:YspA, cpYpsA-related SLOG family